jgi:hypothetical protein
MFSSSKSLFRSPTGGGPGPTDPSFAYVPLLLNTTSTNGQQNNTFLDSSTNNFTITRNGTPTQGSVTPYWPNGQWSNYFNGSTDSVSTSQSMALPTSTTPFTIELWANFTSFSSVAIASTTNSSGILFVLGMGTGNGGATGATPWFGYFDGSAWTAIQSSTNLVVGTWYHLAYVYTGTTARIYANGVSIASGSVASWRTTGGAGLFIGRRWDTSTPGTYFNGYISNFRYVIGAALYSGTSTTVPNFTPPTSPLTSSPSSGTTKILTCQSNRFIDNSANNYALTIAGTPRVQAFQPFSPTASYTPAAYGGSGYFSGNTEYLSLASNAAFGFGTGDFTVEFWLWQNSLDTAGLVDFRGEGSFSNDAPDFEVNSTGKLYVYKESTGIILTTTNSIAARAWTHVAFTRSGTTLRVFINGIVDPTTVTDSTNWGAPDGNLIIASTKEITAFLNGYISNLRIVKGAAVYTGNFTPPTSLLQTSGSASAVCYPSTTNVNTSFASSATSLLTNFTNAGIYDAAVQNNAITVGDAQASTTVSKWSPTSMKFDGTGDWLTAIDGPQLQLGTGDFTIDGWVYLSATGVAYGIISKGAASTGWSVNVTSGNKLQFSYTSSNLTGATSLAATTWYYFAVVRSGSATGNLKVYLNGSVEATSGGAVTDNFNQTSILYVGANRTGGSALNGYLQDVRVTKYARTITTPTAAFQTR